MTHYETLKNKLVEIQDLQAIHSLLHWDMEVMMPRGSARRRAMQGATLAGIVHNKQNTEVPALLEQVEQHELDQLDEVGKANVREIRRALDRSMKLPESHVRALSQATSEAQQAWVQAKQNDDFDAFVPHLEKLTALRIQEAEYQGYEENPYDALMEDYEPGMKASQLVPLFEELVTELKPILSGIRNAEQVDDSCLRGFLSQSDQLKWSREVMEKLGYDYNTGRQDLSAHPFSISFGPEDVRITTVVNENDFTAMLYSSIHEAGHAMYEQGLKPENYGLPSGQYCSLSIHESQSRLWENNIGRSHHFWPHFLPSLAALYPDGLKGVTPDMMFKAVNKVEPTLIRIYSDELHYHMHIALRFEIENELVNGRVKVKDLPELWNARIKEYLDLEVPNNREGVLQDIHWSHGSIGYFPTYSLGSLFAAQFARQAEKDLPQLPGEYQKGEFSTLLNWLRENVHVHGKIYSSNALCKRITGEELSVKHFIDYAKEKYGRVYGIEL